MLIQYRKLTFTLSTHDAGGISEKDAELAQVIDRLAK
jgi:pterin-4a-carbinolamine dehydratase